MCGGCVATRVCIPLPQLCGESGEPAPLPAHNQSSATIFVGTRCWCCIAMGISSSLISHIWNLIKFLTSPSLVTGPGLYYSFQNTWNPNPIHPQRNMPPSEQGHLFRHAWPPALLLRLRITSNNKNPPKTPKTLLYNTANPDIIVVPKLKKIIHTRINY